MHLDDANHPCLRCGACCVTFRVAFHWMESDDAGEGGVPVALTERLDAHRLCMRGTHSAPVRCIALDAEIGQRSRCTIHPQRPSVCRDVDASWEFGAPSAQCDRARMAHGLPVLTPEDWRWRWRRDADNDDQPDDSGNSPSPPAIPPVAA